MSCGNIFKEYHDWYLLANVAQLDMKSSLFVGHGWTQKAINRNTIVITNAHHKFAHPCAHLKHIVPIP